MNGAWPGNDIGAPVVMMRSAALRPSASGNKQRHGILSPASQCTDAAAGQPAPNSRTLSGCCARSFGKSRSTDVIGRRERYARWISMTIERRPPPAHKALSPVKRSGLNGAPGKGPKPVIRTRISPSPAWPRPARRRWPAPAGLPRHRPRCAATATLERAVGAQPAQEQALFKHGPHPFHLLLAASRGQFAGGGEPLPMIEHMRPKPRRCRRRTAPSR